MYMRKFKAVWCAQYLCRRCVVFRKVTGQKRLFELLACKGKSGKLYPLRRGATTNLILSPQLYIDKHTMHTNGNPEAKDSNRDIEETKKNGKRYFLPTLSFNPY